MKRMTALFLAAALCLCLAGCQRTPAPKDTVLFAMDTQMNLRLYGDDDGTRAAELQSLLFSLDRELSVTGSGALAELNRSGSSSRPELLDLLGQAKQICLRTGGAVDPTVYPVVRLWGFTGEAYRVPSDAEIRDALTCVGIDRVTLTSDAVTLAPDTQLDLGAFGKGYASDCCRARLEAAGIPAILSLGGNIQTVGDKPDGKPWTIGVQDPEDAGSYVLTLSLRGSRAVITSGDYQRYFEYEGRRYCHIFDPAVGRPVDGALRSVTVVAGNGTLADGLSTALFVLGRERGIELWRGSDDFEAIWVGKDGTVTLTEGLADLASGCEFTVVSR